MLMLAPDCIIQNVSESVINGRGIIFELIFQPFKLKELVIFDLIINIHNKLLLFAHSAVVYTVIEADTELAKKPQ